MKWDAFISYASEDREDVARPLAEKLKEYGLKIWYDKFELQIGDSLREKIDEGLSSSRYGIIILSHHYFSKPWPKLELEGLVQIEVGGSGRILPVWHNITHGEILNYSPILANKVAGNSDSGINNLVEQLLPIITHTNIKGGFSTKYSIVIAFKKVSQDFDLHIYSLIFTFKLNAAPSKNSFKLKLLWPALIKHVRTERLIKSKSVIKDSIPYIEYIIEDELKIYPGETIDVISPKGMARLEYQFDDYIYRQVEHKDINLFWILYLNDEMPVEGIKSFKELNFY